MLRNMLEWFYRFHRFPPFPGNGLAGASRRTPFTGGPEGNGRRGPRTHRTQGNGRRQPPVNPTDLRQPGETPAEYAHRMLDQARQKLDRAAEGAA